MSDEIHKAAQSPGRERTRLSDGVLSCSTLLASAQHMARESRRSFERPTAPLVVGLDFLSDRGMTDLSPAAPLEYAIVGPSRPVGKASSPSRAP